MKPVIIDFVGTHSTGKTTSQNYLNGYLNRQGFKVYQHNSASRAFAQSQKGIEIFDKTADTIQAYISLMGWGDILNKVLCGKYDIILCTDFFVRSLAYTISSEKTSEQLKEAHWKWLKAMHKLIPSCFSLLRFYFPIEFPLVNDGIRKNDENFRKKVDIIIRNILKAIEGFCPTITITGSIPERKKQLKSVVDEFIIFDLFKPPVQKEKNE